VNRTSGTSNPDLALNGGGWSIASIGGEPAFYLSSNIAASTGVAGSSQTAKGGMGFEYVSSAAPTDLVVGIFGSPTVASSVRIFNQTERIRIFSDGNVGIGTGNSNAGVRLDVNGSTRVSGFLTSGSSTTNGDFTIISNSNPFLIQGRDIYNRGFLALSWDISPDVGTMIGNTLGFNVNANPGVTAGTRALTLATTGAATFTSTLTAQGGYLYGQTNNSFVRLDNSVGSQIGYLNYADITFDSDGLRFYTGTGTSGSRAQKLFLATSGTAAFTNNVRINGSTGTEALNVEGNIILTGTANRYLRLQSATNYYYNLQSVNDDFHIIEAGATPRFVIQYPSGNIGIGTTGPSAKLQVVGANSAEGQLYVGNTDVTYSAGINFYTSSANRGFVGWRHTNSGAPFSLTGIHLFNTDNSNIVFGTNNTIKAVIDVNGNLGVGINSPGAKLDVNGTGNFSGAVSVVSSPTTGYLRVGGGNGAGNSRIFIEASGNNSYIDSYGDSGYKPLQIQATHLILNSAAGNVLVGTTTNGGYKFDVNGNGRFIASGNGDGVLIESVSGERAPALKLYPKSSSSNERNWAISPYRDIHQSLSILSSDSKGGDPYSNGTTRLIIDGISGNVGIGTTSPGQRLHVNGFVRTAGISVNETGGTVSGFIGYEKNWIGSGTSARLAIAAESDAINIYTGGSATERVRFTNNAIVTNPNSTSFAMYLHLNKQASQDGGMLMSRDMSLDWQIINATSSGNLSFYSYGTGANVLTLARSGGAATFSSSITAGGDIIAYSDISVKENIRPIENVLARIEKSRGVLYDRIDTGARDNIGFIAQELEEQFPELVSTNEDETKAVKYQNATAVLFEAVKELTQQNRQQQSEIDTLKGQLAQVLNATLKR
jgi:hypothetical protein